MGNKIQNRTYRERAQPEKRKAKGLLEKKKDYQQRARDFNLKKKRLLALKVKSKNRNPDEFYYKMINSTTTKKGEHSEQKSLIPTDVLRIMKSQDLNYISHKRSVEKKQIEKLETSILTEKLKAELEARKDRDAKLKLAEDKLRQDRMLQQKGKSKKVGVDSRGLPVFKWSCERKK